MKKYIVLFLLIYLNVCYSNVVKSNISGKFISIKSTSEEINAKSYAQNGLFAQWDGIENVGYGKHDSTATTWINLKNGQNIPNVVFDDNSAKPTGVSYTNTRSSDFRINCDFTLHSCLVVCPFQWYNWTMIGIGKGSALENGICFCGRNTGNGGGKVCYRIAYSGTVLNSISTGLTTGQLCSIDILFQYNAKTYIVYVNGMYVGESQISNDNWNLENVNVSIGFQFYQLTNLGDYCVHNILFYKRMLTQDEIAYNHKIDEMRFNNEN